VKKVGEIVHGRLGEWGRIRSIIGSYYEIGLGLGELKTSTYLHESEIVESLEGEKEDRNGS